MNQERKPVNLSWSDGAWSIDVDGADLTANVQAVKLEAYAGAPPVVWLACDAGVVSAEGETMVMLETGDTIPASDIADMVERLDPEAMSEVMFSGDMVTKPAAVLCRFIADTIRQL